LICRFRYPARDRRRSNAELAEHAENFLYKNFSAISAVSAFPVVICGQFILESADINRVGA